MFADPRKKLFAFAVAKGKMLDRDKARISERREVAPRFNLDKTGVYPLARLRLPEVPIGMATFKPVTATH